MAERGSENSVRDVSNALQEALAVLEEDDYVVSEALGSIKRKLEDREEQNNQKVYLKTQPSLLISSTPSTSYNPENTGEHAINTNSDLSINKNNINNKPRYYVSCLENSYLKSDNGPFVVLVESANVNVKAQPMFVGKLIRNNCLEIYSNILSIAKIDFSTIKITLNDYSSANILKSKPFWAESKLVAYIPHYMLTKQGIIRDVDYDITDEEIMEYIISDQPVLKAKRIFKTKGEKKVPTPLVIITFRGQTIPREIKILNVLCKVDLFYPKLIQCENCSRYGHFKSKCSHPQSCSRCGGTHLKDQCNSVTPYCIHCKSPNHEANDKNCPEYILQEKMKKLMVDNNISFKESYYLLKKKNNASYANKTLQNPLEVNRRPEREEAVLSTNVDVLQNLGQNNYNINNNFNKCTGDHVGIKKVRPDIGKKHFQQQENISNSISANEPIIYNSNYTKNINVSEKFHLVLNNICKKIISKEIALASLNLSTEDSDILLHEIINNSEILGINS